ncbi:hypothetical protein WMF37_01725 [Sorangium sp. So ce291]|uniref:hypothetical protein n=1 Tax=Sorangium sp. So ce291 TaxID=3133294 RepID=UPI003F5F56F3
MEAMSAGVGLTVEAELDETGGLVVALVVERTGKMSPGELEAKALLDQAPAWCTVEMRASLLEQLAALVPVRCSDRGVEADVAALARALRKGAVVS